MENNEKKLTNYDRKRLAREEAAKQEKKKNILSIVATVAIVVCIVAVLIVVPVLKSKAKFKEYFKINNESVSELEFNFYRTNLINNYLPYLGMTAEDLEATVIDAEKGTTWGDIFTENAVNTIKQNKALIADAKAKDFEYDVDADYKTHMEGFKAQAELTGMSTSEYLNTLFGANEKELKNIIKDQLLATAYSEYLYEQKQATDEDAKAEYDANKNKYDSVDYRVLGIEAEYDAEATDEEIEAAKKAAKEKADEMLTKVKAGEDFETLCGTYAAEDMRAVYADTATDSSLKTGGTLEALEYSLSPYSEWLFDSVRAEGDSHIYHDEENEVYYVLLFQKRYMGENVLESIKGELTQGAVDDYVAEISKDYTISDPKDNLPTL